MASDDIRKLEQLILDQGVKIEALSLHVRNLAQALHTTEVLYVAEPIDISEIRELLVDPLPSQLPDP